MTMLSQGMVKIDVEHISTMPEQSFEEERLQALSDERTLEVLCDLHTTLDLKTIIQSFAFYLQQDLDVSVHYESHLANTVIQVGMHHPHRIHYQLANQESDCGAITFSRKTPLTDNEIQTLENYLCLVITPLKNAIDHMKALQLAMHDPLTGMENRTALSSSIKHHIQMAKRHGLPFSLLAIDIDHFKSINDTHGHLAGDELLKHITSLLKDELRGVDSAYRTGGEEFIILLSNTDSLCAIPVADRLRKKAAQSICLFENHSLKATISIGLVSYIPGDTDMSLLERVDSALYRAKQQGRNCVCC